MKNQVKNASIKNHLLVLSYKGKKGINIYNSEKRYVNKILLESFKVQIIYTGERLSCYFKTKDKRISSIHPILCIR